MKNINPIPKLETEAWGEIGKSKTYVAMRMLLQNIYLIWSDGFDYSGKHTSWFEKQYSRVCKRNRSWRYSKNSGRSWGSIQEQLDHEEDKQEQDYEYSSTEFSNSRSNHESHRQILGLSSSGRLNLEDVKNAYRACALKWHPDRHHDSTKNAAEARFKLCAVSYQSLCENLAMN